MRMVWTARKVLNVSILNFTGALNCCSVSTWLWFTICANAPLLFSRPRATAVNWASPTSRIFGRGFPIGKYVKLILVRGTPRLKFNMNEFHGTHRKKHYQITLKPFPFTAFWCTNKVFVNSKKCLLLLPQSGTRRRQASKWWLPNDAKIKSNSTIAAWIKLQFFFHRSLGVCS